MTDVPLQIMFYFLFVLTVVPMVVINCHAWLLHFLVLFIEMMLTFSLFGRKHLCRNEKFHLNWTRCLKKSVKIILIRSPLPKPKLPNYPRT